jgi:hypothetical protein
MVWYNISGHRQKKNKADTECQLQREKPYTRIYKITILQH